MNLIKHLMTQTHNTRIA